MMLTRIFRWLGRQIVQPHDDRHAPDWAWLERFDQRELLLHEKLDAMVVFKKRAGYRPFTAFVTGKAHWLIEVRN